MVVEVQKPAEENRSNYLLADSTGISEQCVSRRHSALFMRRMVLTFPGDRPLTVCDQGLKKMEAGVNLWLQEIALRSNCAYHQGTKRVNFRDEIDLLQRGRDSNSRYSYPYTTFPG